MIAFEWNADRDRLDIHADAKGLVRLSEFIEELMSKNSPRGGELVSRRLGGDLNDEMQENNTMPIDRVVFSILSNE